MSQENDANFDDEYISEIRSMTTNSIQENEENITLIWFNPVIDKTDDTEKIKEGLRAVNDVVLFPTGIDSCIADIKLKEAERIFLITSAENALKLPPTIIGLSQLDSIFIFPENREQSNKLRNDYPKVVDSFDNPNGLIKSIKQSITHSNGQLKIIPFYDQHQRSTRDLSEQSAEFLWFQLFKYVIQGMPHDDKAKQEMLSACRQYYQGKTRMLEDINKFDQTYSIDECIRWYTKDTFVYQLINKALRTEDIEQLYIFRYYIADLSRQLVQRYDMTKNEEKSQISLYRGALMNKKEIETFKENMGQLIAVNSYWSTTSDRSYAFTFANKFNDRRDIVRVLFEMKCNLHDCKDSVIVGDISDLSEFQTEKEFLFDAGSIFQIEEIREEENGDTELYVVQIRTTGEGREIAKKYIKEIQEEMKYESPRIMLGILLKRMGKYEKSLQYFEELLKNPGEEKISHIHNRIGIALRLKNKYDSALENFDKAYDLTPKSDPSERIYLAFIRHNQGQIAGKQGKFSQALKYYQDAVKIVKKEISDPNRYIADYYSSIGRVYLCKQNYKEAMYYQRKALRIREACLPSNHVIHAFSYAEIAKIFAFQSDYEKALEHHHKALELRQKYLLPNHVNTAWSLYFVGKMYHKLGNSKTALDYYLKSLEMTRKCLPDCQLYNAPSILQDIALIYGYNSQEALKYRLEALDIENNTEPVNYSSLAHILDNIAFTYKSMGRKEDSRNFYRKALQIRENYLYNDRFNLARTLNGLASVYEEIDDMPSALNCYYEIMNMCTYHYHSYHWLCKQTKRNIHRLRQ